MNRKTAKTNETLAPKLISRNLSHAGKVLTLVGKPFYFLLLFLILSVLFLLNITGRTVRIASTFIFKNIPKLLVVLTVIRNETKSFLINLPLKHGKTKQIYPEVKRLRISLPKKYLSVFKRVGKKILKLKTVANKKTKLLKKPFFFLRTKVSSISIKNRLNVLALKLKLKTIRKISLTISLRLPKLKTAAFIFGLLIIITSSASYLFLIYILSDLPDPHELTTKPQTVSTKIYDRNNELLYNIYEDENRTPVPLDRIPAQVRLATIAIEDAEFYQHPGFSIKGILRAIIRNIQRGELTGGSTITQQLVKNVLLSPQKTLIRKLREIVLAVSVEKTFTKDEILTMYLNEVSYGGTSYGIQEAANSYFGKNVDELTLGESALLAGLPKSPTKYSPFGQTPKAAYDRQKEVLRLMRENGFITEAQRKSAEEEKTIFANNVANIKAPHFVMYVRHLLAEKYGEELVSKGGLEVTTTLDLNIQKIAEEAVKSEVEKLGSLGVGNGAAIVLDVQTGEVLAMVGSKDYFDIASDGNVNLTTSERQPGSSIKIVNYSYALSHSYTPLSILEDTPETFTVNGQPPYTPKNYDGLFRGKLTLRSALAESRNVPAVKVLASYGVPNMIEQGRKMGITSWIDPSQYGLSLTLGGGEVKLIDLATVYATIANYGKRPGVHSIKKITNYEGSTFEQGGCETQEKKPLVALVQASASASKSNTQEACKDSEQVLDARVAYMLMSILSDNNARSPAFGSNSLLVIPGHPEVAVKTGTSNDLRDNLTVGFNQKYLVAVWVGNNDNSEMSRVASGITGATPIWNKIMSTLIARRESKPWNVPEGLVSQPICSITGSLACTGCVSGSEWFLVENQPAAACNPEYIKFLNEQREKNKDEDKLNLETASTTP